MKNVRGASRHVALALGYLAIGAVATWPAPRHLSGSFIGSAEGDAYLVAAILEWGYVSALRGFQGFWDAPFFFPTPRIITYSEHVLGILPLYAPFRLLSGSPVLAYNAAYLLELALCGYGGYLLSHGLTRHAPASFLAGALFEVLPYKVYNADHQQCLALGFVPLTLLALHRHLERGGARDALLAALSFMATFLSGFYNGIFLGTLLPPYLLVLALGERTRLVRAATAAAWILAALGLLLVIHLPMLRNQREHELVRSVEENAESSARPTDYLRAPAGSLAGRLPFPFPDPNVAWPAGKRVAYLGLLPMVLAGAALVRRGAVRPRWMAAHVLLAASAFVLSLGPRLVLTQKIEDTPFVPLPYLLLYRYVPGYDAMRTPVRLAAFVAAFLVPVVAAGAAWLLPAAGSRTWALAIALVVAHRIECWPATFYGPRPVREVATDAGYRALPPATGCGAILEIPCDWRSNAIAMWAAAQHGRAVVNGWTGFELEGHQALFDRAAGFPAPGIVDMVEGFREGSCRVERVIWRRERGTEASFDEARRLGGRSPRAPLLADGGDVLVFGLRTFDDVIALGPGVTRRAESYEAISPGRLAVRAKRFSQDDASLSFASSGRASFRVPWSAGPAAIEVSARSTGGADPIPPVRLRLRVEGRVVHEALLPWDERITTLTPPLEVLHAGDYEVSLELEPSDPSGPRFRMSVVIDALRASRS